jgi:hypothetical protein
LRFAALICFLGCAALPAGAGQPALDALRTAWSAALDDWKATSVETDRELFQRPPADALSRIDEALAKRRRVTETRQEYILALVRHYRQLARRYQEAQDPALDPPGEAELRDAIVEAIGGLDKQLKTLPAANRAAAPVLERQRGELRAVQAGLRSRQQARARAGLASSAGAADTGAAAESLLALANRLEAHDVTLRQESGAWDRIYAGLKDEVERRAPRPVEPAPAAPTAGSAVPLGAEASQAVVPSLAGIWFLQNLDARKTDDGAYEPRFVNVRITQQEDKVQGNYEAVYAVPEEEAHNPTVRFSFEGRITTEILRFPLRAPLRGYILMERSGPLRMRVSYSIENPEVRNISFGYVGPENPQNLQKKID